MTETVPEVMPAGDWEMGMQIPMEEGIGTFSETFQQTFHEAAPAAFRSGLRARGAASRLIPQGVGRDHLGRFQLLQNDATVIKREAD